jgi:DNA repair protein RadD
MNALARLEPLITAPVDHLEADTVVLRDYQAGAVAAMHQSVAETEDTPLVILPTGTGKSLVSAQFVSEVLEANPTARIAVITHVKELIAQNYAALRSLWPDAPAGILSAGLGRREIDAQILLCSIQSAHRHADGIGHRDFVVIDEAHLVSRNDRSMYRSLLRELRRINPAIRILGLTATAYRLDTGKLHEGEDRLFDAIAYQVPLLGMVEQGYLVPVRAKLPHAAIDVAGVGKRGGEFIPGQLEAAADKADLTEHICDEIVAAGADRGSWLCFCSGVAHAEHVRDAIRKRGVTCETVTGGTPDAERDAIVADFKTGVTRALTNVGVFTTGFDAPGTDLIALLRPTCSPGLYVQMLGRGMRLAAGKDDCLVLDFAGNVARHGPVDTVDGAGGRPLSQGDGVAPTKTCPACREILHAAVRACSACGHVFPEPPSKLAPKPTNAPVLSTQSAGVWRRVRRTHYRRHFKPDKPVSLRLDYECDDGRHYSEWVCLQHAGYPRQKAEQWWQKRAPHLPCPDTVDDALRVVTSILAPSEISVVQVGQYPEIRGMRFNT